MVHPHLEDSQMEFFVLLGIELAKLACDLLIAWASNGFGGACPC